MAIKSVCFLWTFDFAGNKRKTIAKVACISVRESREVDPTKYTTINLTTCREIYLVNQMDTHLWSALRQMIYWFSFMYLLTLLKLKAARRALVYKAVNIVSERCSHSVIKAVGSFSLSSVSISSLRTWPALRIILDRKICVPEKQKKKKNFPAYFCIPYLSCGTC